MRTAFSTRRGSYPLLAVRRFCETFRSNKPPKNKIFLFSYCSIISYWFFAFFFRRGRRRTDGGHVGMSSFCSALLSILLSRQSLFWFCLLPIFGFSFAFVCFSFHFFLCPFASDFLYFPCHIFSDYAVVVLIFGPFAFLVFAIYYCIKRAYTIGWVNGHLAKLIYGQGWGNIGFIFDDHGRKKKNQKWGFSVLLLRLRRLFEQQTSAFNLCCTMFFVGWPIWRILYTHSLSLLFY